MLFNSIEFCIFVPIVFLLYWFVTHKNLKLQNLLILLASYVFYGWWDWRFLSLIFFSSLVDYLIGMGLSKAKEKGKRKLLLLVSIIVNLGLLGFFKYFNFFAQSFADAFTMLGQPFEVSRLNIILPIGISFYTFQTLSYSVDVYNKKIEPTFDFLAFFSYVSFFPQLVAGPIERASNLLPQFYTKRKFEYANAVDGLRQILWGFFKKVVIADNFAVFVNIIFKNSTDYNGSTLALGALFFAFQVYGDFSGYSDIAIGLSRLFGFNLRQNFAFPYFSRNIVEFWRRWHISLSTWFRDYIYFPLGGNRVTPLLRVRNIFIVFIISGLWHGAGWTYIIFGALQAIYMIPFVLRKQTNTLTEVVAQGKYFPSLKELLSMGITFTLFVLSLAIFRADNLEHAFSYLSEIFSLTLFEIPYFSTGTKSIPIIIISIIFFIIEWIGRNEQYGIAKFGLNWKRPIRLSFYYCVFSAIIFLSGPTEQFIYFQF